MVGVSEEAVAVLERVQRLEAEDGTVQDMSWGEFKGWKPKMELSKTFLPVRFDTQEGVLWKGNHQPLIFEKLRGEGV